MTYLLAPIGTRDTTEGEVEAVIEHHVRHPAFWSAIRHDSWAKGSRVVAKMTGVGLLVLTGTLDCSAPAHDPLAVGGQIWEWRYAMRWDCRRSAPSRLASSVCRSIRRRGRRSVSHARTSTAPIARCMAAIRPHWSVDRLVLRGP